MRRRLLSPSALDAWAIFNGVESWGITTRNLKSNKGLGIVATASCTTEEEVLMRVPQALVLSLENVWIYAKSDRHLQEILEAVGDYSRAARGAILIFLIMQLTHDMSPEADRVGNSSPLTEYISFLPSEIRLPTFWSETERSLAVGTSLEAALEAKLNSLEREFANLYNCTKSIGWCHKYWWDSETGSLSIDDWKLVDAMYRSRALELPGTGHAMVPCIDMANHASGDDTMALYDTDANGNAVLVLRSGKILEPEDEVSITYGDEKGACEMLFSYGFIEDSMLSARELFLDLDIPDDDPLKRAKKIVSKSAPGFRLFSNEKSVDWEGEFVWIVCVNEEDGLKFHLPQTIDGGRDLTAFWNDNEVQDMSDIKHLLKADERWDVFQLRAIVTLQGRVEQQLLALEKSKADVNALMRETVSDKSTRQMILRFRDLEEELLLHAYEVFEKKVCKPPH